MLSRYYIIYPRADRSKLKVCELTYTDELSDYAVASRNDFSSYQEAADYARELATTHNKTFIPADDEPDYLD